MDHSSHITAQRQTTCVALALSMLFIAAGCNRKPEISRPSPEAVAGNPSPDMARVYFVRPAQSRGGNYAVSVWNDDRIIGYIRAGQHFYIDLPPGSYSFMGVAKTADMVEAHLAPGRTYYVHVRFVSFYVGAALFMDPLTPSSPNWSSRREWVDGSRPMTLISQNAAWWNATYREENRKRLERLAQRPASEKKFIRPEDGE